FRGQTSGRSDQYSLAVTYCQLRGGRLPFTGNAWEVMMGHSLDAPDLTMLPAAERPAGARRPAQAAPGRRPDCRAFVAALADAARAGGRPAAPARPRRRAAWASLAVPLGFLVLVNVLGAVLLRGPGSGQAAPVPAGGVAAAADDDGPGGGGA